MVFVDFIIGFVFLMLAFIICFWTGTLVRICLNTKVEHMESLSVVEVSVVGFITIFGIAVAITSTYFIGNFISSSSLLH